MTGFLLIAALLSSPGPFVLVNGSGAAMSALAIRPSSSAATARWTPLDPASLSPGARVTMRAPAGDLCAFDIRARVGSAEVSWTSVNLCDVRSVTLNRRADGTLWADYD